MNVVKATVNVPAVASKTAPVAIKNRNAVVSHCATWFIIICIGMGMLVARRNSETHQPDDRGRPNYGNPDAEFPQLQTVQPDYRQRKSGRPTNEQPQLVAPAYRHGQLQ